MSTKKKSLDIILKEYISNNTIFADIVNYYLYDGKFVVKESDLKELDTTSVSNNDDIFEKNRDLFKEVTIKEDNMNTYILFGIENQSKIDKKMILRVLLYDALSYRKQILNKTEGKYIIKPVITIVIYYGTKKWSAPKTLHEMFKNENKELLEYIPNYHLNLIEPFFMNDEDISKFSSEFKIICDSIRYSETEEDVEKLLKIGYNNYSDETKALAGYILNINIGKDEEGNTGMCKGVEEIKRKERNKGIIEGALENEHANIKTMHKNGADIDTIAKLLSLDINYVKEVLAN